MDEISFPSVQEFKAFNPSKLCLFLKNKFKDEQESFHYFEILEQEKVSGKSFMLLTREHIQGPPYNFSLGSILLIEGLIRELKSQEKNTDVGSIETSMEKMNIKDNKDNTVHSKLNDIRLLRRLFKGIAEANAFTFKEINDEIKSTNHSISETTIRNFYHGDSDLSPGNKLAVQKWVGKFIDEWKKDGRNVTILVKLDPAHSTK